MFSEINQKNKLEILGKLAASLSHELRNPLSAIKLNLDYMKMGVDELPEEMLESLESCITGVERIEYLIENILSFSRRNRNSSEKICINDVSKIAVSLSQAKASREKITISTEYLDNIVKVEFSKSNLLQVFLNLITNAIEACNGNRGKIFIKTHSSDTTPYNVVWAITDNGMGIKDEIKEKIFGDFFTNKETGTGIGLTVCKNLLEEKDAKLEFSSEFGKGTTFRIFFKTELKVQDA